MLCVFCHQCATNLQFCSLFFWKGGGYICYHQYWYLKYWTGKRLDAHCSSMDYTLVCGSFLKQIYMAVMSVKISKCQNGLNWTSIGYIWQSYVCQNFQMIECFNWSRYISGSYVCKNFQMSEWFNWSQKLSNGKHVCPSFRVLPEIETFVVPLKCFLQMFPSNVSSQMFSSNVFF